MFSWYRQSALTVVHLEDVSANVDADGLSSSEWFKRGWTLQELLAPATMLFFTNDWTLYRNSVVPNHKNDPVILRELEQASGIPSRHLRDFHPGMDDARSRLRWASGRRTTRPQDMAYSLFGLFNLHLPVLYSESVEDALGRLLAEIISQSGETSLLDWVGEPSSFHSCFPASFTSYASLPCLYSVQDGLALHMSTLISQEISNALRRRLDSLLKSPRPHFINHNLTLPCIVHRLRTIQPVPTFESGRYVYVLDAVGLKPLKVALPAKLDDGLETRCVLVRPWNARSLSPYSESSVASEMLVRMLDEPFHALLLLGLPRSEYKRIASHSNIVAYPADLGGILNGEVMTLNVV
ncbi:hypothetical protein ID866_12413 [Astraeus odoratus]|nr:hypothetical protein ID866_12413 [Astraeus odoratus]